jgi:hypothetical protein
MNKTKTILSDLLIGIPGGLLIFMSTMMFNAVLGKLFPVGAWGMLLLLCIDSFIVGLLARWMRPLHGLGTAVASGLIAALILLVLWQTSAPRPETALVVGPAGMLGTVVLCIFGGWVMPRLRKASK